LTQTWLLSNLAVLQTATDLRSASEMQSQLVIHLRVFYVSANNFNKFSSTPVSTLAVAGLIDETLSNFAYDDAAHSLLDTSPAVTVDSNIDAPKFLGMIDHSAGSQANLGDGETSHDAFPGIVFVAIPGTTYKLFDNGTLIGTMVATRENTNWTVPSQLFNGEHHLVLRSIDATGKASAALSVNITVDAGPPVPVLLGMVDHSVSEFAEVYAGHAFADATPGIVLRGNIGDTIGIFDDGLPIATIMQTKENMNITLPALANGIHHLSITTSNAAGVSMPLFVDFTVAAPAPVVPATPVLLALADRSDGSSVNVQEGGTSHSATPFIAFVTVPGNIYTLYDNGVKIGEMVAGKNAAGQDLANWSVPVQLANGAHQLSVVATSPEGLKSLPMIVNFTVDAGPAAPLNYGMIDHSFSNYADFGTAHVFKDATPGVVMAGNVGDTLRFYDAGILVSSVVMTEAIMNITLPALAEGVHHLAVTSTNASGISVPLLLDITVVLPHDPTSGTQVHTAVGLHDTFVATGDNQTVDLNVNPNAYFSQASAHIEGGASGAHTLHLTGNHEVLNLTSLTGKTAAAKISGMEIIDMGGHFNTVNLSLVDVLNLGQTDLFLNDGNAQMMIKGSNGDMLTLSLAKVAGVADAGWAGHGTANVGGVVYNVYEHAGAHAELLVQQGVQMLVF
jgi:hypothetical protein